MLRGFLTLASRTQDQKEDEEYERETLVQIANTALRTKTYPKLADHLTEICVDAVNSVHVKGQSIDLHMVEIMHMR